MGLFKPAWQSKDKVKAVEAVKKLTDQTVLSHIAKGAGTSTYNKFVAKHIEVGIAAVEKLTDQILLTDVATNAFHGEILITALEKLTDQAALADIAKNNNNITVRYAAVKKLTDKTVLADIVKNDKASSVSMAAYEKLTGQRCEKHDYEEISREYYDTTIHTDSDDARIYGDKVDRYMCTFKCKHCGNIRKGFN